MTEGKKENPALVPAILADNGTSRGHEKRLSEYAAHKVRQNAVSAYILEHHPEYRKQYHRLQYSPCPSLARRPAAPASIERRIFDCFRYLHPGRFAGRFELNRAGK